MAAPSVRPRRRACALALVLAPLLTLFLWQSAIEPQGVVGRLSADSGLCAAAQAPAWFVEEVIEVDGRDELRANEDWSVVSFVVGEGSAAMTEVVYEMEERGWALVKSGSGDTWTGVKEGGRCSWVVLSGVRVSDAMCVVLQTSASAR